MEQISIQIENSYKTWRPWAMKIDMAEVAYDKYQMFDVQLLLRRKLWTLYVEWWLHNIGYWITKPFSGRGWLGTINSRCKDVDLERWK